MACGSVKQLAISAAKSGVDLAKADYNNTIDNLKAINPEDYNSRQEFEDAKAASTVTAKGKIDAYKSTVALLKVAGLDMPPIDLLKVEAIALADDLTNISMAGIIPLSPDTAPTLALSVTAKTLKENLLC